MWKFAWKNLISRPTRTALAVVGLTIPVLAYLGLFSVSRGIRDLMGDTLGKIQGLMVLRENSPSPVFSDLSADLGKKLRSIPGVRIAAAEVWKIAPPIDGKVGLKPSPIALLTRPKEEGVKLISSMYMVEGQDLPDHLRLKAALYAMSILPKNQAEGRFLTLQDLGKPHVVISTKLARDFPNTDGTPKKVGQKLRIGTQDFTIVGLYETGSLVTDMTALMEISVARKLLGVAEGSVSTFDVEPVNIVETDALAMRIEAKFPGVRAQRISQFNLTVGTIMGKLDAFLFLAVSLALVVVDGQGVPR
ncbi:ABC transporter permease [Singulisphaera sp. Ch08]|uniref:ABC transporter permease n=1 Tax=Singulisphaera sp. Ch08 TaxID=3120278 RepID=A0AAU7CEI5_9BACT